MLNTFRSFSNSLIAKIFVVVLLLSFGLWGVEDMLKASARNAAVATVGNEVISANDFSRQLHQETENLRLTMGESFSPELIKNQGLARWVLQKQVNNALLRMEAKELGLIPGDAEVVRKIRSNPDFQDSKGNFDKNIFEARLKNMNMAEKNYVELLRQEIAIRLIIDTIAEAAPVSPTAIRTLFQAKEEQRIITMYTIPSSLVTDVAVPSEEQIKKYYDSHNREFSAPEYRNVSYVVITSADAKEGAASTEKDLKKIYEQRVDEFKRSERRDIEQLLYASEDKAKAALRLLKQGKTFQQVAAQTPVMNKDAISMGTIERNVLIENAEEKVFSLKDNEVSDVIQSPFGWHIFHVVSIQPATTLPFEEVKETLEKEASQRMSDQGLIKLANKLEDSIAGGNTLNEAAQELKLKVVKAGPFDKSGKTPEGLASKDIPELDKFLDIAFKTEEKTESQMMTAKGGVFYILRVDSTVPERLKALEEVKGFVINDWQKEERQKKMEKLADEIAKEFANPQKRAQLVERYKLTKMPQATIKRSSHEVENVVLPNYLVADVFTRAEGESTQAYAKNDDYFITVVNTIIPLSKADEAKAASGMADIKRSLKTTAENEILEQYVTYLATKYTVSIHDGVLQSLIR